MELIDRQAALAEAYNVVIDGSVFKVVQVETLYGLPTIDAVPVVRCKDCKWWGLSSHNTFDIHICKRHNGVRFESDFCSRAERSEE